MQAGGERIRQGAVDEAVTLDPALAFKRGRYDIKSEVRFAACAPAGVSDMLVRFIIDLKVRGSEALVEPLRDKFLHCHSLTFYRYGPGMPLEALPLPQDAS